MILMIGSYGAGISCRLSNIPGAGETVDGAVINIGHGGKTSNQAVAAARQGANVSIMSVLGEDGFANNATALWKEEGINSELVRVLPGRTMSGMIVVDDAGENRIALDSGVLDDFTPEDLDDYKEAFERATTVVLALEIPAVTVERAIVLAKAAGAKVILNPAPAHRVDPEILQQVDYLIPNEIEYEFLLDHGYEAAESQAVIITRGSEGAELVTATSRQTFAPYAQAETVDTTGAGDTFVGTFAAAIDREEALESAIQSAIVASALAVTKPEVIPAIPSFDTVQTHLPSYLQQQERK